MPFASRDTPYDHDPTDEELRVMEAELTKTKVMKEERLRVRRSMDRLLDRQASMSYGPLLGAQGSKKDQYNDSLMRGKKR